MKIRHLKSVVLVTAALAANLFAAPSFADAQQQQCSNTTVQYKELTPQQRTGSLTPEDSVVFSSPHYCVGYKDKLGYNTKAPKLTTREASGITSRYALVWANLTTSDEKVAFAHYFLQALSKRYEVYAKTSIAEQLTIVLPSKTENEKRSGQAYLTHNLSNNPQDYYVVKQGLETLAQIANPNDYLSALPDMKPLIKWVISGQGKMDYFDSNGNTLLPDGSSTYCFDCYYHIEQILADGGASYGGSYDWQGYASWGYSIDVDDGFEIESELCNIYLNCAAGIYEFFFDDLQTVGEECVSITYNDGTEIRGLYCQVIDNTPGPA